MRFNRLKIKGYRKFEGLDINFSPKINIILGSNEAGKSTLSRAVLDAMFLNPESKARQVKDTLSWGKGGLGQLELYFENSKGRYELMKDLDQGKCVLKGDGINEVIDQSGISDFFKASVGIGSESMYKNTAFISHKDMASIENSNDLIEAIRGVAVEGEADISISRIMAEFKKKLQILNKGRGRSSGSLGPIMALSKKIGEKKNELQEKEKELEQLNSNTRESYNIKKDIKKNEKEREVLGDLLLMNDDIKKGRDKEKELRSKITEMENKLKKLNEIKRDEDRTVEELGDRDIIKIKEDIELLRGLGAKERVRNVKAEIITNISLISLVFASFILFLILNNSIYLFISFLIGTVSVLYIYLIRNRKWKKNKDDIKKEQEILSKYALPNISELISLAERTIDLDNRLNRIKAEKEGMLFENGIDEIERKLRVYYQDLKGLSLNELDEDKLTFELEPKDYLIKKHEKAELDETIEGMKTRLIKLEASIENMNVTAEDVRELEEEIKFMQHELEYHEQSVKVYELVLDGLEHSLISTAKDFKLTAKDLIEGLLGRITLGRYDKVEIGNDLSIKVYSKEKNDWVLPQDELSSGTIDEIYFILRLAFLELLGKKEKIPIILDDPFVTFDDKRLEKTREILEVLKDQQVLLFTHNRKYSGWGNVIELDI